MTHLRITGPKGRHIPDFRGHIDNGFHPPRRCKIVDPSVSR